MKKINLVIICLTLCLVTNAQTFKLPSNLNTGAELVELTLKHTFVSLHQDYALEDNDGQRFGRGGGPCFNSIEYIGIATNEGVLFFNDIMHPWEKDVEFTRYKESYKPFLISSKIGFLGNDKTNNIAISDSIVNNYDNKYYILPDSVYNQGLIINKTDTLTQNGWFVWITTNKKSAQKVSFNIYKKELPKENLNGKILVKDPNIAENMLGALYITPVVSSPGKLQFKLEAIICKDNDSQDWVVVPIGQSQNKKDNVSLTPLEKKKDEK